MTWVRGEMLAFHPPWETRAPTCWLVLYTIFTIVRHGRKFRLPTGVLIHFLKRFHTNCSWKENHYHLQKQAIFSIKTLKCSVPAKTVSGNTRLVFFKKVFAWNMLIVSRIKSMSVNLSEAHFLLTRHQIDRNAFSYGLEKSTHVSVICVSSRTPCRDNCLWYSARDFMKQKAWTMENLPKTVILHVFIRPLVSFEHSTQYFTGRKKWLERRKKIVRLIVKQ